MSKNKLDELYNKIEELEKKKFAYLEIDNNAYASRIQKQIDKIRLEIELFDLEKLKKELSIYKKVVRNYPGILCEVKSKLLEIK